MPPNQLRLSPCAASPNCKRCPPLSRSTDVTFLSMPKLPHFPQLEDNRRSGPLKRLLIAFVNLKRRGRIRLGAGNVLSGCGKPKKEQRQHVGGVTDSCLACSASDTGESSVWACSSAAACEQNHIINCSHEQLIFLFGANWFI